MKEWATWGRRHEKSAYTSPTGGGDTLQGGPGAPPAPDEEPTNEKGSSLHKSPTEANQESEIKKRVKNQSEEAFTEDEVEQMMALLEETTGHLGEPGIEYN